MTNVWAILTLLESTIASWAWCLQMASFSSYLVSVFSHLISKSSCSEQPPLPCFPPKLLAQSPLYPILSHLINLLVWEHWIPRHLEQNAHRLNLYLFRQEDHYLHLALPHLWLATHRQCFVCRYVLLYFLVVRVQQSFEVEGWKMREQVKRGAEWLGVLFKVWIG